MLGLRSLMPFKRRKKISDCRGSFSISAAFSWMVCTILETICFLTFGSGSESLSPNSTSCLYAFDMGFFVSSNPLGLARVYRRAE